MKWKIGNKRIELNLSLSSNTDKQLNEYKKKFREKTGDKHFKCTFNFLCLLKCLKENKQFIWFLFTWQINWENYLLATMSHNATLILEQKCRRIY